MWKSRGRLVAVAAVLVAIVLAVVLWQRRSSTSATTTASRGSGSPIRVNGGSAGARGTGGPHWFARGPGRKIAGVVIGDDGAPIANATVRLASEYSAAKLVPAAMLTTDAGGRFDFGVQHALEYVISAQSPKLTAAISRVNLNDPLVAPPPESLTLVLHACDASIHGTIFDTSEGPIRGATVMRASGRVATQVAAESADDGSYELCVPVGGASVVISADGYAPARESVDVYGRTKRDFRLVPGASVVGHVVRADDKLAVAGAIVELGDPDDDRSDGALLTSTDADGAFHFDAVTPGRHNVSARADRLATRDPVAVVAEVGAPAEDVVCELSGAPTVSGTVAEQGTHEPIAGEVVYLMGQSRRRRDTYRLTYTDAAGAFAFETVRPGDYSVRVGAPNGDAEKKAVTVEKADVADLAFEIAAPASLEGRVVANAKPVEGASVRFGFTGTTTDANGRFVLRNLEAGERELYAQSERIGAFTRDQKVTLAAGEHRTGVEVVLDLAGSIAGTVVDQNDAPVAGAFLSFSLLRGRDFGSATTADDGTFTVRALSGGGDYTFEVKAREESAIVYPPASGKRHAPITVKDGQTHITGVRVKLRIERLAISGRVIDSTGKPVADVRVTAVPGGRWERAPDATTDETGAFSIKDLPAGTYDVAAKAARGEASIEGVAAGQKGVTLTLMAPGGVDGTLEGFSKAPDVAAVRMATGEMSIFDGKVTGTTFQIRGLAPGHYQVNARVGTERASQSVDIVAGQIKTVKLAVGPTGTVAGTVVDKATRLPVPGLRCYASAVGEDRVYDAPGRRGPITDARGAFRIERAPTGDVMVACFDDEVSAWGKANVPIAGVGTIELTADKKRAAGSKGKAGMTLENQLDDVLVKTVEPGGAAARAGIAVGDAIISVNGKAIGRYQSYLAMMLVERGDTMEPKIVLERADMQQTVTLKLDPIAAGSAEP